MVTFKCAYRLLHLHATVFSTQKKSGFLINLFIVAVDASWTNISTNQRVVGTFNSGPGCSRLVLSGRGKGVGVVTRPLANDVGSSTSKKISLDFITFGYIWMESLSTKNCITIGFAIISCDFRALETWPWQPFTMSYWGCLGGVPSHCK